jgi:hypothetical protein
MIVSERQDASKGSPKPKLGAYIKQMLHEPKPSENDQFEGYNEKLLYAKALILPPQHQHDAPGV